MEEGRIIIDDMETVGALIRQARKEQGLTQREFADIAGVGIRFLSELERGKDTAEVGLVLQVSKAAGFDVVLEHRKFKSPFSHFAHSAGDDK